MYQIGESLQQDRKGHQTAAVPEMKLFCGLVRIY